MTYFINALVETVIAVPACLAMAFLILNGVKGRIE